MAVEDRPGSLYEMLGKMAALDISMTKLESCPVPGSDFGFIFFIEMEGSVQDKSVLSMLAEMERCCPMLYFLGNYSEI